MNTAGAGDFFYYDGNRLLEHHHDSPTSGEDYLREYVWGLEYIDEAVAQYDSEPGQAAELFYLLIDANYNVVAVVDAGNGSTPPGTPVQQYSYWPYGSLLAAESYHDPGPPEVVTTIDFETYPEQLATNIGHQGLHWDLETWLIHNRRRTYNPELGRFMQRDPNETAQLLYTALLSNGSVALMFDLPIGAGGQYGDGMSLYAYLRSNPLGATDPSGLYAADSPFEGDEAFGLSQQIPMDQLAAFGHLTYILGVGLDIVKQAAYVTASFTPGLGQAISAYEFILKVTDQATSDWNLWDWVEVAGGVAVGGGAAFKLLKAGWRYLRAGHKYKRGSQLGNLFTTKIGCFAAGTAVLMADGSVRSIEYLREGDQVLGCVWSVSGITGQTPGRDRVRRREAVCPSFFRQ